ncbi:MAG: M50 family metallopeptidase [Methanomassiliicoccaceae archaeon]|jgi:hypothetical protein|nr:M50 family metallopeptidase [Methanomassiliicoccaceae archaeon]
MDNDHRAQNILFIMMLALIAMMFSVMFMMGDELRDRSGIPLFAALVLILSSFVSIFFHIFVHEFGHALFGKLSGYTLFGISVAGVWIFRTETGRKVRFFPIKGAGGATLSVPSGGYKDDTPYAMMIMGGITMNILATAAFVAIAVVNVSPIVTFFAWIAAIFGVYFAVSNLIPMRAGFAVNDGALLRLFRKDAATKHCMHFMQMDSFALISGVENRTPVPADLPYGNPIADIIRITLADRHIAQNRSDEAELILKELTDNIGNGISRNLANMRLLFIYTMNGADKGKIDAVYDEKMKKFVTSFSHMDLCAILFLIAYEKRFSTGNIKTNGLVKRFNKIVKKVKIDTSYERSIMMSLLSDAPEQRSDMNEDK